MWNRNRSVTLSLVVCFLACAILTAGLFAGPWAVKMWFLLYRGWSENGEAMVRMLTLFKVCFYPCAVLGFVTLYSLMRLLLNIKENAIFIMPNVKYLRRISWCCFAVSLIVAAALTYGFEHPIAKWLQKKWDAYRKRRRA